MTSRSCDLEGRIAAKRFTRVRIERTRRKGKRRNGTRHREPLPYKYSGSLLIDGEFITGNNRKEVMQEEKEYLSSRDRELIDDQDRANSASL